MPQGLECCISPREDFLMEEKKRKFDDRGSGDFISEPFKGFITEVLEQDKGEGLISLPLADINQKINAPNLENLMVDEEVDLHEAVEDTCKIAEVEEAGKEVARVKEEVDVKEEDDKKRV
ncbi:uncharacterized protein [Hetaerina americana]|uniref:uncharacterized protein n=1 Tax=Hetaerina americana TaxID=62018 RepID=UPI003A7F2520